MMGQERIDEFRPGAGGRSILDPQSLDHHRSDDFVGGLVMPGRVPGSSFLFLRALMEGSVSEVASRQSRQKCPSIVAPRGKLLPCWETFHHQDAAT